MQNAKLWGKNYRFLVAVDIIDERRETKDERKSQSAPHANTGIKNDTSADGMTFNGMRAAP